MQTTLMNINDANYINLEEIDDLQIFHYENSLYLKIIDITISGKKYNAIDLKLRKYIYFENKIKVKLFNNIIIEANN